MTTLSEINVTPQSGLNHIDALIDELPDWNLLTPGRNEIFYTFSVASGTQSGHAPASFNFAQIAAARAILAHVSSVTGIIFTETLVGGSADWHFGTENVAGASTAGVCSLAASYSFIGQEVTQYSADAWIYLDNVEWNAENVSPTAGNQGYETLLHEVGHALGLKHPFEDPPILTSGENTSNTVMSYTHVGGPYSTFRQYDVAALNFLYGKDGLRGSWGVGTSGEYLTGTSSNDTITASTIFLSNIIDGGAGDDVLNGGAGADTLIGGLGNDSYIVDNAGDVVTENLNEGTDLVQSSVTHALAANVENLTLTGAGDINGSGNTLSNLLIGNGGANTLDGSAGDDRIEGGEGNDSLNGGVGVDTLNGGADHDGLFGGNDNDVLEGDGGNDGLFGEDGHDTLRGGIGYDALNGGAGNDALHGGTENDDLDGGAGYDELHGDDGADTLLGGTENDLLNGGAGNDVLRGDAGVDTLNGGADHDGLYGGSENDVLEGADGNDGLYGEEGDDLLRGEIGYDALYGGAGHDGMYGGSENDVLEGGDGNDGLYGEDGHDTLRGEIGYDALFGGAGNDALRGGTENDDLDGGAGYDELTGGDGSDRFDYNNINDGIDTITDFTLGGGGDMLDIRDVLVGYVAGSSNPANFVQLAESGGNTTVSVDADGVGGDFVALTTLQGVTGALLNDMLAQGNLVV